MIYVWTPQLAERSDMEPYEPPVPQPKCAENTSENPISASAEASPDEPLEAAKAAFRRQVSRVRRKPASKELGET